MNKINIVVNLIIPKSPCYNGKTGGIIRLTKIMSKLMGKKLNLIINTTEWVTKYFKKNGILAKYNIVESSLKFQNKLDLAYKSLYLTIRSLVFFPLPASKNGEKIVVYATSDLFWETIPAFFWKMRNRKIEWIQVIHHIYPDWKKRPGNKLVSFFGFYLQKFSFFLARKKADKIIVLNEFIKKELAKRDFDEKRVFLNSNGIDFEQIEAVNKSDKNYDGVFLGRLSPSKGIADLIEIWKKVCEILSEARLAIVGGGSLEEKNNLLKKIKKHNLEKNIEILGFLGDDEVISILKSGKFFLFPSHEEGWGIAIAEAMAAGLPVVSWNLPVYQEVFENHTLQMKENNIGEFSSKVIELFKDNALREKLSSEGKEFVKKYSWKKVAEREMEIICK